MAKKYDDFDDGDQSGFLDQILNIVSRRKREFAIVSVSAAVLLLGLVVWGSYPDSADTGAAESVPIVRADAGDYKTTPENPGGMEVPYRDSTVFSSVGDNGTENILAEDTTEEPVPRSQLFAGLNTEGEQPAPATTAEASKGEVEATMEAMNKVEPVLPPSNDTLVKEAIGVPASSETKPAPVEEKVAAAVIPEAVKPKVEEPAPEAKTAAKIESAAGAATAAKAVQPGGYYVQLASVRSKDGAAGEFKKLQAKYSSLNGLKFRTQEANLGAKGTFHRIQAGPMSKESATDICTKIKKVTPGACLVTK